MLLHTGFVGEVDSTGDIPYTEMPVELDLYGMEKGHDLHVKCYNCVFSVLIINISVKYLGKFPLTEL